MSTTHHQVVGKCKSSEAREFMGETFSGAKPIVFSGNVAPGVAEVGSLFPRFAGLDLGKRSTKSALDCTRLYSEIFDLHSNRQKSDKIVALLEDEVCKIHWFIGSLVRWFGGSVIHWFIDSLIHRFSDSFIRWFIESLMYPWWFQGSLNLRIIGSLLPWFSDSLTRWFVDSLTHWILQSWNHWFTDSLIHWLIESLHHWFIGSLMCWFTVSLFSALLNHWFIGSLIPGFTDSLTCSYVDSLLHCFIDSLNPWFIASFTELCMDSFISWSSQQPIAHSLMNLDAPHNFNNSWFLHRKNFPTSNWFLTTISFFRNFRLSAGRALPGSVWTTQQMSCISSRAEVNQPLLVLLAFAGWSAHHGWVRRLHASTKLVQIQGNVFFFPPCHPNCSLQFSVLLENSFGLSPAYYMFL